MTSPPARGWERRGLPIDRTVRPLACAITILRRRRWARARANLGRDADYQGTGEGGCGKTL